MPDAADEYVIMGWTGCNNFGGPMCLRLTDKEFIENDRILVSNYWAEQINRFGQLIKYYVNTFDLNQSNNIYGEHPLAAFHPPKMIVMGIDMTDTVVILSKYGFRSDEEITAVVHMSAFNAAFEGDDIHAQLQQPVEPKSGDLIELYEFGSDRPNGRTGRIFQITERLDEDTARINQLGGHYVWFLRAKRYEYSYEPNAPQEGANHQIYENEFSGLTTLSQSPSSEGKTYVHDVDLLSKTKVFNQNTDNHDDIYGDYG